MGFYRLLLAYCVLHSHAFGPIFGVNVGVVAVISFFVMSGYVMTRLRDRHYPRLADVPAFYLDRAARLFPQFLFYLALTLVLIEAIDLRSFYFREPTLLDVAAHATMLPLGFFMLGLDQLFMPQGWSLGLELCFYLAVPFYLLAGSRWRGAILAASLAVFALATLGVVNTDYWGYRLLPGTFFIFAAGIALARADATPARFALLVALGMAAAWIGLKLLAPALYVLPFTAEVLLGGALGIPLVALLAKLRFSRLDDYLGDLSYGVFLNHFILIWIAERYALAPWLVVPLGSLLLSALTYRIVEQPALRFRRRLRRGLAPSDGPSALEAAAPVRTGS
jgi:peptidoglycan/LPS O-acetylase OafA/YrhL